MSSDGPTVSGLAEHPQRIALNNEVHARPYERLEAPLRGSYIALLSGVAAATREHECVQILCRRFGIHPPAADATHFSADLGPFRLRWERHTEFSSYTFWVTAPFDTPFDDPPLSRIPAEWLSSLPGELLSAVHVAFESRDAEPRSDDALGNFFSPESLVGSRVAGGAATAWTDFHVHGDGFARLLIRDHGLGPRQAGRLLQRLLEIETYRLLALLALPLAREHTLELFRLELQVAEMSNQLVGTRDPSAERALLERLTGVSAEVERIAAATGFRFGAAAAYYEILQRRVAELREARQQRLQTFGDFMQRRLAPGMKTCESVAGRIDTLTNRVARVSDLLRTRVNVAMESQSRDLLESMNRRAALQLRLQETVEGLSVVVLSYYLVGLVNYGLKGLKASGFALNPDLLTGIAIVPVVALVIFAVKRMRRVLMRQAD